MDLAGGKKPRTPRGIKEEQARGQEDRHVSDPNDERPCLPPILLCQLSAIFLVRSCRAVSCSRMREGREESAIVASCHALSLIGIPARYCTIPIPKPQVGGSIPLGRTNTRSRVIRVARVARGRAPAPGRPALTASPRTC